MAHDLAQLIYMDRLAIPFQWVHYEAPSSIFKVEELFADEQGPTATLKALERERAGLKKMLSILEKRLGELEVDLLCPIFSFFCALSNSLKIAYA